MLNGDLVSNFFTNYSKSKTDITNTIVGVMTDEELADCMNEIASLLGLDLELMSVEEAHQLNTLNPDIWPSYCSAMIEAFDSDSLFASAGTVPTAPVPFAVQGSPSFYTPAYPKASDVSVLYAEEGFTGNTYDRITSLADRCDTGDEAADIRNLLLANIADEAAEASCGGFAPACVAAGITGSTLALWRVVVDGCTLHDGLVDGAEIEATFENVKTLMTDEVGHFESLTSDISTFRTEANGRFTSIDNYLIAFQAAMNTRFDTVDSAIADFRAHVDTRMNTIESILETRFNKIDATLESRFNQVDAQLAMLRTLAITPEGRRTGWSGKDHICDGDESGNCALVANYP